MRARAALVTACAVTAVFGVAATASAAPPQPLDPQNWSFQDNLTWADYKKLPGPDYSDPAIQPTVKKWKVALVMVDFPTAPFIISQPAGSTICGTPTVHANSVPRADVPQFYADFLNKPSTMNNFQTMNRYWMEDSFGKYGVELMPYGPYRMPRQPYQYFISAYAGTRRHDCPTRRRRHAVQPQHPHGPARGLAGRRRRVDDRLVRQHLLHRPPARTRARRGRSSAR